MTLSGVNLGGWLVIEKWMTPSLFAGTNATNEYELSKTKQGRDRIKTHHETFVTKDDLMWLKAQGIEMLRVPVGYWIFGQDSRYVGAIERLDWLVTTSLSLGFKLLLDLHAAPGAQNNAAHSGSGNSMRNKHSTKWLNNNLEQDKTIEVLCALAERYYDFEHIWGIELLNEPVVDLFGTKLARFYRRAYSAVTNVARSGTCLIFSDGYAPLRLTGRLWLVAKHDFPVIMDVHIYRVFGTRYKKTTFSGHIAGLTWTRLFLRMLRLQQPIIVGEWSAMLPIKTSAQETRQYIQSQQATFNGCEAWFYWSYKTEDEGRWNYYDQALRELVQ